MNICSLYLYQNSVMPRPRNSSKVQIPPRNRGFMPLGYYQAESEIIQLHIEEFESIRLLDYENLSQEEAAQLMEISRPTLTRIYNRARKKVATAFTESRQILIEGGKVVFNGEWTLCATCESKFNTVNTTSYGICPLCSSKHVASIEEVKQ